MQERNRHKEFRAIFNRKTSILNINEKERIRARWLLEEMLENGEELSNFEYDAIIEDLADILMYELFDGNVPHFLESPERQALDRLNEERKQNMDWLSIFDKYIGWCTIWELLSVEDKEQVVNDILDYLEGKYEFGWRLITNLL